MATSVVDRSVVNSVFSRRSDNESSQYDSSEDSDEERQLPNNVNGSKSFVIIFSDDDIDTATGTASATASASGSPTVNSSTSKDLSLQEAFKRFKKKKQKQIRRARKKQKNGTKEARLRSMANPDRMGRLRMKFLDEAKRYMGVPYAKKYWKPEDPEYKSKLFLDCCGLVRRVMLNLKSDFGFHIGPWNQAYMYDTLPITVKREEDMKPGDLVFISATYHNPKMKKQKHSMTHVEIWLGDGVKTIGARWNKGKVQVFDSYRFKAMSYHSETYIFKSIDTWLKGQCRSHCPYHTWKRRSKKFKPSKNSVFRLPQQDSGQSESDKSAGDAESQLTKQQCSASTLDSDIATKTEQSSSTDIEEKAEDEMPEVREKETRLSLLRSVSGSTNDESSLCSSVSGESVEDVLETARRRMSRKKAEDQMSELTVEEGTTDESSVCSSVSVESAEEVDAMSQRVKPLRSVLKISKIRAWESGKNAHNMKQQSKGEPKDRNIKKSLSSASRETMQRHIECSKRGVGNLALIRSQTSLQKAVNRNSVGNLTQGSVQSKKGWAKNEDGPDTERPAEARSSGKKTKVPPEGSGNKSRVHCSKSDNDLQSSKTHSVVSRRPSF